MTSALLVVTGATLVVTRSLVVTTLVVLFGFGPTESRGVEGLLAPWDRWCMRSPLRAHLVAERNMVARFALLLD